MENGVLSSKIRRACTDNDRGGTKGSSYAARWIAAGLDRMERAEACTIETSTAEDAGITTVRCSWMMRPRALSEEEAEARAAQASGAGVGETGGSHWFAEVETLEEEKDAGMKEQEGEGAAAGTEERGAGPPGGSSEGRTDEGEVKVAVAYRVHGASGLVECEWSLDASAALPAPLAPGLLPSLPRVGITAPVNGSLSRMSYFGRGPQENYVDRKYGAHYGVHEISVPDESCPYVFPQECGGREDVRFMLLRGAAAATGTEEGVAGPSEAGGVTEEKEAGGVTDVKQAGKVTEVKQAEKETEEEKKESGEGLSPMEVEGEAKEAAKEGEGDAGGEEEKGGIAGPSEQVVEGAQAGAAEGGATEQAAVKEGEAVGGAEEEKGGEAPTEQEAGKEGEAVGGVAEGAQAEAGGEQAGGAKEGETEAKGAAAETKARTPALAVYPLSGATSALHVSAIPFSLQDLQSASHDCDLKPTGHTHVHLDAAHMGVGGDDSWSPATREPYLVAPATYQLKVALLPCRC